MGGRVQRRARRRPGAPAAGAWACACIALPPGLPLPEPITSTRNSAPPRRQPALCTKHPAIAVLPAPAPKPTAPALAHPAPPPFPTHTQVPPNSDDVSQSWFFAETLKYFFLLFSPDATLSLSDWVLNTEAHPLKVQHGGGSKASLAPEFAIGQWPARGPPPPFATPVLVLLFLFPPLQVPLFLLFRCCPLPVAPRRLPRSPGSVASPLSLRSPLRRATRLCGVAVAYNWSATHTFQTLD